MEKELRAAKRFNKAAVLLIMILLILLILMLADMKHWVKQYEQLEGNYEKLCEEMMRSE